MKFNSYRSPVYGTRGIVASSQPLACEAGMRILKQGGNAADAAVATAAALNVTQPISTGIGGDMFALYYDSKSKNVHGINGSGRAPSELTIEKVHSDGYLNELPVFHPHTITVPGAAAGWVDTIDKFGTLDLKTILKPAIELARNGFPVSDITAFYWERGVDRQLNQSPNGHEMLKDGNAPGVGEIMKNLTLANTFESVAEFGNSGFYDGRIAESIIEVIQSKGGVMNLDDLKNHKSTYEDPISVNYHGIDVFEIAPNGQGITALMALNILEEFEIDKLEHNSTEYLHLLIESMRIAFADTRWYVADASVVDVPIKEMISKKYAKSRLGLFNPKMSNKSIVKGYPISSSDTVYFSVVDGEGNACSFINSNYMGFGTGIIPKGCGFTLQNRGHNFSLQTDHPNVLAPNKRPYHTIIPAMATKNNDLWASFGVMGGFAQPQSQVQVLLNMIHYDMNPQESLDASRFCINDGKSNGNVALEEGIAINVMSELANKGHTVIPTSGMSRMNFGTGQIIRRNPNSGVLTAGSDPRSDGQAIAW